MIMFEDGDICPYELKFILWVFNIIRTATSEHVLLVAPGEKKDSCDFAFRSFDVLDLPVQILRVAIFQVLEFLCKQLV